MNIGFITGYGETDDYSTAYGVEHLIRELTALGNRVTRYPMDALHRTDIEGKPDITLSIGCPDFLSRNRKTCDVVQRPHLSWVIEDPINMQVSHHRSPHLHHITIDRQHSTFLVGQGHQAHFIPLGAPEPTPGRLHADRELAVVFTGQIADPEQLRQGWMQYCDDVVQSMEKRPRGELYAPALRREDYHAMIEEALECSLSDPHTPLLFQIRSYLHDHDLYYHLGNVDNQLEQFLYRPLNEYLRSLKQVMVIASIHSSPVHCFGICTARALLNQPNLVRHPPVNRAETFDLFQNTRIAINVTPHHYDGCHDRAIVPVSLGAAVLTNNNPYLYEHFIPDESMMFYDFAHLGSIDTRIENMLKDPENTAAMAQNAVPIVERTFTWKRRIGEIHDLCRELVAGHARQQSIAKKSKEVNRIIGYLHEAVKRYRAYDLEGATHAITQGFDNLTHLIAECETSAFSRSLAPILPLFTDAQARCDLRLAAYFVEEKILPLIAIHHQSLKHA